MAQTKIAVIVGSLRKDSFNRRLAVALAKLAPSDVTFEQVRIDDLPLYNQDDDGSPAASVTRLKAEIQSAQGLLFVTPEYNRSIPGVLKNALDHGSRPYGKSAFPGKPAGHPTKLGGTPADVEADCRRFAAKGCAGVDLLAYRATEADPIELVRAARRGTPGYLLVAGSVATPAQIRALREAGADAFTIGSAAFDGSFAPRMGSLRSQLEAVLEATAA